MGGWKVGRGLLATWLRGRALAGFFVVVGGDALSLLWDTPHRLSFSLCTDVDHLSTYAFCVPLLRCW